MPYIIKVLNCDIPYIWCPKTISTWTSSLTPFFNDITVSTRMTYFYWMMVVMDLSVIVPCKYFLNVPVLPLHILVCKFYQMELRVYLIVDVLIFFPMNQEGNIRSISTMISLGPFIRRELFNSIWISMNWFSISEAFCRQASCGGLGATNIILEEEDVFGSWNQYW